MGRWGVGMTACDEFADVVDEYFGLFYYTDKPLSEIEQEILQNYGKDATYADPDDGIWHDVYFALADCGWKCGYIGGEVARKVEEIIAGKHNLAYLKSLDMSPRDLKQRAKVLDKFLAKIKSANDKPVRRTAKTPFINPFQRGDVFVCKYKGLYYGGVVLQVVDNNAENTPLYQKRYYGYCIAVAHLQSKKQPATEDILRADIRFAEWLDHQSLPKKGLTVIGNVSDSIASDYIGYLGSYYRADGWYIRAYSWDIPLSDLFSPAFDSPNKHMQMYDLIGKPITTLFDTDNMIKTEQVLEQFVPY